MHLRPVAIRYSWPAELDLMTDRAGLRLAERYADWDRQPFTAASDRHVSVYRRARLSCVRWYHAARLSVSRPMMT